MKKIFFIFILFILFFSVYAEFQHFVIAGDTTIKTDKTTTKTAASFKSTAFQFNLAFELKPEKKLKTFGIKYSPVPQATCYYGNLSFGGIYGRIKTPCFSIPNALSSVSVPTTGITISLPSATTSSATPKSICFKTNIENINITYFMRYKTAKTEQTEYFAGIDYHPARTRFHVGFFGGMFEAEKKANTRWFLNARPFEKEKIRYAVFEASYNGSYLKILSTNIISNSPYEHMTGSWRFCTTLTSPFLRLDSGFFWCDADHITIEETFLRKTLVSYIRPQLKTITFKNGHKFRSGITFAVMHSYSSEIAPECTKRADLSFASEYRTSFLTFNMNIKCANALHNEAHYKAIKKFLYYTDKTSNTFGFGLKISPSFWGHTQQISFSTDFIDFPLNKTKNQINASTSLSFIPAKNLSFFIKQTFSLKTAGKNTEEPNIYNINSIKTEFKAKYNLRFKNNSGTLTAKTIFKKEIEDPNSFEITFYYGATLYIKK